MDPDRPEQSGGGYVFVPGGIVPNGARRAKPAVQPSPGHGPADGKVPGTIPFARGDPRHGAALGQPALRS